MTRHMSGPLREKAGLLLLSLFSLRDHVPPSVTPGTSQQAPPPDPVHALISWHVAGLFALASCPCERQILTMLWEGLSLEWSNGRGVWWRWCVYVCVDNAGGVGCQDEQQEELSALFVHSNVQLVYFNV